MNTKFIGDKALNCTIGELAKWDIGIAFPLSDNYPFDLIVIAVLTIFRAQVKSSSSIYNGSIVFNLRSSNYYKSLQDVYPEYGYFIWY